MRKYPDLSGPPRSYVAPLIAFLVAALLAYLGYWWYLQGLEEKCRDRCIATGHKQYQYVEPTGSGRHFRRGSCSCIR